MRPCSSLLPVSRTALMSVGHWIMLAETASSAQMSNAITYDVCTAKIVLRAAIIASEMIRSFFGDPRSANTPPGMYNSIPTPVKIVMSRPSSLLVACVASRMTS